MPAQILNPHRLKGSSAHMQRHPGKFNAFFLQLIHDFRRKMQTGCRRSDRPLMLGIDSLIALPVGVGVFT